MCGIAGFTAPGPKAKAVLAAMNRALAHRGPDGAGVFVDREVALGHTRLAIIDLAGGAQPRIDEASGDALVFNGEIYGYQALADELRGSGVLLCDRSDTEVLFQLIRRDGVRGAVERVDGEVEQASSGIEGRQRQCGDEQCVQFERPVVALAGEMVFEVRNLIAEAG